MPFNARLVSLATCTALATVPLLPAGPAARAATYTVSETTWGTSSTLNSFAWALAQANGNLGHDTISVTPGLAINVDGATAVSGGWLTTISDALTIQGHGATLVGNPSFLTNSVPPIIHTKTSDADGVNQLINPIDGSPILRDVLGQPRTSAGLRTIGAVQPAPVPAPLPFVGAAAALAWSRRLRRRSRLPNAPERLDHRS